MRLIQVGLGPWGLDWARTVLADAPGVEVVAWVDRDTEALATLPAQRCFTSLTQALRATEAEAVLVTVAINAHTPVAIAALRAGKHVLLEKPFAPTLREAREILAVAEQRRLILSIAENYRFVPAVARAAELVREGRLGYVNSVRVHFGKPGDPFPRTGDPVDSAVLVQMSIHHFDVLRFVLGQEPVRVWCRSWTPPWSAAPADVCTAAMIEFDGGSVVSYTASLASRAAETPWWGTWHIEGEAGELSFADELVLLGSRQALPDPGAERAAVLAGFVAAVRDGIPPPSPGWDNIRSVALMDAAVESAATGRVVDVAS